VSKRVLFLPGASGAGAFWRPVAKLLPADWDKVLLDLPGFGNVPADPRVNSFEDLVQLVVDRIGDEPVALVAQSMGGAIAMQVAVQHPRCVRRMVLVATSGGVDLSRFDLEDWRAEYRAEYPQALPFVTDSTTDDLSEQLRTVQAPVLLVWARGDGISPPEVGEYLATKLADARLHVLEFGDHMFARDHAADVAPLIAAHLQ
jgi:pimeloyl-ACP methyl ester carboxylesterase